MFKERNSRGEITSRSLIMDKAHVIMRGGLVGKRLSKGHLDCKGLLLSPSAIGEAVPVLRSVNELAELTHETGISKISRDELKYLISKVNI